MSLFIHVRAHGLLHVSDQFLGSEVPCTQHSLHIIQAPPGEVLSRGLTGLQVQATVPGALGEVGRVSYLVMSPRSRGLRQAQGSSNEGSLRVSVSSQLGCSLEGGRKGPQWTRPLAVGRGPGPRPCTDHIPQAGCTQPSPWGEGRLRHQRGPGRVQPKPAQRAARSSSLPFPKSQLRAGARCHPPASRYFTRRPGKRQRWRPFDVWAPPASALGRSIFAEDQRGVKLR